MWSWLRRVLKWTAVVLLVALAALLVYAVVLVRRSWPTTEGQLAAPGLTAPVEVLRDRWGVPHMFAASAHDLFFAQGFVAAQDRAWQMHFNRVVANGQLASLFGQPVVGVDSYLRTVGLRRSAAKDLTLLDAETRTLLEAYAAGVNAFLTTHRGRLPVEFKVLGIEPEPWTALDVLAFSKAMSFNLSLNSSLELLRAELAADVGAVDADRFLPPYPADAPTILGGAPAPPARQAQAESVRRFLAAAMPAVLDASQVGGSNAWVVAGSRTKSGKPILANDTHLALGMPSVWYEVGLHAPGYDAVGFSLPGIPFVVIGQTPRVAWGITNLNADVQDLYLEKVDSAAAPTRYEHRGSWQPIEVVHETIAVKGGEPVDLPVYLTAHGPLMHQVTPNQKLGQPYSLAWTALAGSRLLEAMRRLNQASDWVSFRDALSYWDSPSLNFVYADVDGNVGYQSTAQVPLRQPAHTGTVAVDGASGDFDWQGLIPFAEMPSGLNPPAGFYATANNKVVGDDYPYVLTRDWPPADRARRITALLAAAHDLTVDDMQRMQLDDLSLPAARLRPTLLVAATAATPREQAALALVRDWDTRYGVESTGATIYHVWLDKLTRALLADDLSKEAFADFFPFAMSPSPLLEDLLAHPDDRLIDDRRTPEKETLDLLIGRSFQEAVAWLSERLGDDPAGWQWSKLHHAMFVHQPFGSSGLAPLEWVFNGKQRPVGGEASTILALSSNPAAPYRVGFGVSQRFVADLADLGRSRAVNSTGQVGLPFHRHREDLIELWARGELHPVLTSREAVSAQGAGEAGVEALTLTPASNASR